MKIKLSLYSAWECCECVDFNGICVARTSKETQSVIVNTKSLYLMLDQISSHLVWVLVKFGRRNSCPDGRAHHTRGSVCGTADSTLVQLSKR